MAKKAMTPPEDFKDVHFPSAGVDGSVAFGTQPNRPIGARGQFRRTCVSAKNVQSIDPETRRNRGGSRGGLNRFLNDPISGDRFIAQDIETISTVGTPVASNSGRVVTAVAVSEGRLFYANEGATSWTEATNNTGLTPPLRFSGILFSTALQQKRWYVDRLNSVVFSPALGTVELWTATDGEFPVDSDNNLPRLIETWRGRIILSGLLKDPQNIFMSKVDNPYNFDYSPLSPSALDAVALNIPDGLGLIGDMVTGIVPYTDDLLIIGCDGSLRIIRGDPLAGGQVDTISRSMGMAWGRAWARDQSGNIYFFSNHCSVCILVPGQMPQVISQPIDHLLRNINTGDNAIRLLWDERNKKLKVFVTSLDGPNENDMHYQWEQRTGAWFPFQYANPDHNPLCCCTYDGNDPDDRVPLIGSWDGVVRTISESATTDDGTRIDSEVLIGPFVSKDFAELTIRDALPVMGMNSNPVYYDVLTGRSPEEALASTPKETGVWQPGRGFSSYLNWSGHAIYFKIRSQPTLPNDWSMESVRITLRDRGRLRARQQ